MFSRPRFRADLSVRILSPERLLVASATGDELFESPLFVRLAPLLDGRRTLAEIVECLAGAATAVDVRFGLDELAARGVLSQGAENEAELAPGLKVLRDALGLDAEALSRGLARRTVAVESIGRSGRDELVGLLTELAVRVEPGAELTIVTTADPFAAALERLADELTRAERTWLLVRSAGAFPWAGPLLRPGVSPCWSCVRARLAAHRPWSARSAPAGGEARLVAPPAAPVSRTILEAVVRETVRWLADPDATSRLDGHLLAFEPVGPTFERHRILPRTECRRCGVPAGARIDPVVRLRETIPIGGAADGGFRTLRPRETFDRLAHHVSPLVGIIHSLEARTLGDGSPFRVWIAEHGFSTDPPAEEPRPLEHRRSAGKGISPEQARASAICEALERYSGVFRGTEPRRRARLDELGAAAIDPRSVLAYSARQLAERTLWNATGLRSLWVGEPFDPQRAIEWTPCWSLTAEEIRYLPTAYCYYGYRDAGAPRFCRADSNGCAAGNCREEAIFQGLLELVERDAVALWWYQRVRRPGVAVADFGRPDLDRLLADLSASGRPVEVLELTHDLGIPVFAAVSVARGDGPCPLLLGFGAHPDRGIALGRALTELAQFWPGALAGKPRRVASARLDDAAYLEPFPSKPPPSGLPAATADRDLARALADLLSALDGVGLEVVVLDQTRADARLPVVRVVVPGLRHFWPRFAPGRLYDVPRALGWTARESGEEALNPVHLLI